jgi:beta-galactosidase
MNVMLKNNTISIGGKPVILLCSSLFYFRIPPEYWQERMRQLKISGYNAIDVYFPWNFHEISPEKWCFEGMCDVDKFLNLAAEIGLYVVARPGPYICSEWDGGGFPAWLGNEKLRYRQYDKKYLNELERWMDKILPIIAEREYGKNGSVVLLQLENELDCFNCEHPRRYLEALARMARKNGIRIPLVACAGVYDVESAGATAEGIYPAYNIYPANDDAYIEEKLKRVYAVTAMHDVPFITTETNREHRFIRRELICGLRLISPYCQTATANYSCYNGMSAWGSSAKHPISYMTNDYDHGAMIKADGVITDEYLESRLIGNILSTFGEDLATGNAFKDHGINVTVDFLSNRSEFNAMELQGGGWLLCIPNHGEKDGQAEICYKDKIFTVTVEAHTARILPFDLPLQKWGIEGTILRSSLEIGWIGREKNEVTMAVYGDGDGMVLLLSGKEITVNGDKEINCSGMVLRIVKKAKAEIAMEASPYLPKLTEKMIRPWDSKTIKDITMEEFSITGAWQKTGIEEMERKGLYRGVGVYRFTVPECEGLILEGAGDILRLYHEGNHIDSWFGTGGHDEYDLRGGFVELKAETWGHSCFDGFQFPVMGLGSLRGIRRALAVRRREDIFHDWKYFLNAETWGPTISARDAEYPVIANFGKRQVRKNWEQGVYYKDVVIPREGEVRLLRFIECELPAAVYVDGRFIGEVNLEDPYVDISGVTYPGKMVEIAVRIVKSLRYENAGNPLLICADVIRDCDFLSWPSDEWPKTRVKTGQPLRIPLVLKPGEIKKISIQTPPEEAEQWLWVDGQGIMVSVFLNDHVLGRLFVGCDMYPGVVSGDPERIWLPKAWLKKEAECTLLVEALYPGAGLRGLCLNKR